MSRFLNTGLILLIIIVNLRIKTLSNTHDACSSMKLNEVLANPAGTDAGNEWVELHNCSSKAISLSDWKLRDKSYNSQTLEDVTVGPNKYYITYPTFSLNQSAEEVVLLNPQGEIIDQMSYEDTKEDKSWARIPDGIGEWVLEEPSPEKTNTQPTPEYNIIISEIYPSPETGEDEWIELYNNSENTVNISNWTIEDTTNKHNIVDLYISPFSYIVIEDLSITLNNSGDSIQLKDTNNNTIHSFDYNETSKGLSIIWNDGNPIQTKAVTKGGDNQYISLEDQFYNLEYHSIQEAKLNNFEQPFIITGKLLEESQGFIENKAYIHDEDNGILVNTKDIDGDEYFGKTIEVCGTTDTYYSNPIFNPISGCLREIKKTIEPEIPEITSNDLEFYANRLITIEGDVKNIKEKEGILIVDKIELKFKLGVNINKAVETEQTYLFTGILNKKTIKSLDSYTLLVTTVSESTEIEGEIKNTQVLGSSKYVSQLKIPSNLKLPGLLLSNDVFIPHKVEREYRKNSKPIISGTSTALSIASIIFIIKEIYIEESTLD